MGITNISEVQKVPKSNMVMPVSVNILPTSGKCKSAPFTEGPWEASSIVPTTFVTFWRCHTTNSRVNIPLKTLLVISLQVTKSKSKA